jgi:hypothetical protein
VQRARALSAADRPARPVPGTGEPSLTRVDVWITIFCEKIRSFFLKTNVNIHVFVRIFDLGFLASAD